MYEVGPVAQGLAKVFEERTPVISADRSIELVLAAYRAYRGMSHFSTRDTAKLLSAIHALKQAQWFAIVEHLCARVTPHEAQTSTVSVDRRRELAIAAYRTWLGPVFVSLQDMPAAFLRPSDIERARWLAAVEYLCVTLEPHEVQGDDNASPASYKTLSVLGAARQTRC